MCSITLRIDAASPEEVVFRTSDFPIAMGRDANAAIRFDDQRFPQVSWRHAELRLRDKQVFLVHVGRSNPTLMNGKPITTAAAVQVGDMIRLGATGPEIEIKSLEVGTEAPEPTMLASAHQKVRVGLQQVQIPIQDRLLIGRASSDSLGCLDHPLVSRQHASIQRRDHEVLLEDLGSSNGTYVNGERIDHAYRLTIGDVIDIGPYSMTFDGDRLTSVTRANNSELRSVTVGRTVSQPGRRLLTLLQDVSFVIKPGTFVCILGPSGSGKSTLLNVLSGRNLPSAGQVLVNHRDLHANFAAIKETIVVVPQTTTLHMALTVEESLRFTASLRLPSDTRLSEVAEALDRSLTTVGLADRRQVKISNLSGGQLKRIGLASELLADPSLIFLDEVTSGLDERSDGEMMALFRELADAGKTVVCVTHNLANIERYCDTVAVLTVGGRLAFCGPVAEAKTYFGITHLSDIYEALDSCRPEEWAARFVHSVDYAIQTPTDIATTHAEQRTRSSFLATAKKASRQFSVLALRSVRIWMRDWRALLAMVGQAALVAILIGLVFGDVGEVLDDPMDNTDRLIKIRNLLFLVNVSVFWLGCNNSAKELVKERTIYRRERDFNLVPESYLCSKLFVLYAIGVFQTLLIATTVFLWTGFPGSWSSQIVNLLCLSFAGTGLGLAISAWARTEEVAIALVPLVVIPQIILAGVVAKLSGLAKGLAQLFVTVYWGQQSAMALPDEHRLASDDDHAYAFCLAVILAQAFALILVSWFSLRWRRNES